MTEGQHGGDDRPSDAPGAAGTAQGLGRSSAAGPAFRTGDPLPPPPPPPWRSPATAPRPGPPPPTPPDRSRLPALLTAAVVALVVAVVAGATVVARYADTHVVAAPPPAAPTQIAAPTADPGGIDFTSARGRGRLLVLDHRWETAPAGAGPSARHLRIRVELLCTRGRVGHAPEFFSLFDDHGQLVEASLATEPDPVPLGTLGPGERVRGHVAFDLPRGDVTLVLSDEVSSVTAVRVPG